MPSSGSGSASGIVSTSDADIVLQIVLEWDRIDITLGDKTLLRAFAWGEDLADISACTATVQINNSDGTSLLATTPMDDSGTTKRTFSYLLETGAAELIEAGGSFRATYKFSYEGTVLQIFQDITVSAVEDGTLAHLTRSAG